MKGLLVKDFQILRNQSKIVLMLAAISLFLGFSSSEGSFVISYCTFCLSALVTTTVSYDDLDNGYSFLFTLPITRKIYVVEKYLLALIICSLATVVSTMICLLGVAINGQEVNIPDTLMTAVMVCMLCLVMVAIMLPIQMKYGAEKSRVIIFGCVGGVMVIGGVLSVLAERMQNVIAVDIQSLVEGLENVSVGTVAGIMLVLVLVVFVITMSISVKVMEKKEM